MSIFRYFLPFAFLIMTFSSSAGQVAAGPFDQISDTSRVQYDTLQQRYQLTALKDSPTRTTTQVDGEFMLTTHFRHDRNAVPSARTGLMVTAGATNYLLTINPKGEATVASNGGRSVSAPKFGYSILQVERSGGEMIFRAAISGEPFQEIVQLPTTGTSATVGLHLQAGDSSSAEAWNVRIEGTVPDDYDASSSGHLTSRLEVMDVFTGQRRVIHQSRQRFEAPNWMPDSSRLLINEGGSLYTIGVDGEDKRLFPTGDLNRNNNDHGISFDGKQLAISHHREGLPDGGSTVYVMDLEGGEPRLVTENTPSYWHGWAPNNEEVVYVARREQAHYDIYKKSINGGEELRLSDYEGSHADGPEYTPDGEYIYYNACPTGTMQIWRMFSDGWNKEQITFDEYNDWFPHISPDGQWIVFLSYPKHIDPKSHPTYKRVMLRMMPVSGGAPRVIGYLFGGQGTINVPSWSPDSRSIAFVSYSRE